MLGSASAVNKTLLTIRWRAEQAPPTVTVKTTRNNIKSSTRLPSCCITPRNTDSGSAHSSPANHMSDHRMALPPFSTLATYAPDGDHDTALMAELHTNNKRRSGLGPEPEPEPRSGVCATSDRSLRLVAQISLHTEPALWVLLVVSVQNSVHFPRQDVPDVQSSVSRASGYVAAIRTVHKQLDQNQNQIWIHDSKTETHLKVTLVQSAPHLKPSALKTQTHIMFSLCTGGCSLLTESLQVSL